MFDKYIQGSVQNPRISALYASLKEHVDSTRGIMSALGSFWFESFGNLSRNQSAYESVMQAMTGCVLPLSDAYRGLLDATLEASIQSIPEFSERQLELVIFIEPDASNPECTAKHVLDPKEAYVFYKTPILDADYFMANLFGSPIVLEKGKHFTVDRSTGDITFYVDIFSDYAIIQDAYGEFDKVLHPQRSIMLWGVNVVQESFRLWERYGQLVYRKAADSPKYKALIRAIMYYYVNMKSVQNVENVMNIIYGVPYAQHEGEVVLRTYDVGPDLRAASVTDGDDNYHCIETSYNGRVYKYYCYGTATLTVQQGDVLHLYQLMGRVHEVYDYIQLERHPEKFIPAIEHPENMTRDEQIDYVYEHWNDADGTTAQEDDIELSPNLRSDIIRNVLKYNSLFIKHIIDLNSINTYKNQIEEMRAVLRSGLPVYLNPMLETIFKLRLADYIPTDMEIAEEAALAAEENRDPRFDEAWHDDHAAVVDGGIRTGIGAVFYDQHALDIVYDGSEIYNGGTCRDHDSASTSFRLRYDGYTRYIGDYAHHGAYTSGAVRYDGKEVYGNCFSNMHSYERDVLVFTNVRTGITDEFPYSDTDGSLKRQIYYNGSYYHDGDARYGLVEFIPKDLTVAIVQRFDDSISSDDRFEIVCHSDSGSKFDFEDNAAQVSDAFTISIVIQDGNDHFQFEDIFGDAASINDSMDIKALQNDVDYVPGVADELEIAQEQELAG